MKTIYGPKEKVKDGLLYAYYEVDKDVDLIRELCLQFNLQYQLITQENCARVTGRFCDIVLFCESCSEDEETVTQLITEIRETK